MELIIDIPKQMYLNAKADTLCGADILVNAIKNGTPLPKGHGRLIDADELKKIIQEHDVIFMRGFNVRICDINATPTIIEADKEREDKG